MSALRGCRAKSLTLALAAPYTVAAAAAAADAAQQLEGTGGGATVAAAAAAADAAQQLEGTGGGAPWFEYAMTDLRCALRKRGRLQVQV